MGAPGPTGANGIVDYAYVFNTSGAVVGLENDVPFDSNGVLTTGFTHVPGTAAITVANAGTYKLTFSVSGVEPSQFGVFDNGLLVAGSIYGSGAGTQQNTGQVIFLAAAGDAITVRNHTSAAAVTLQTVAGGTATNVNASVAIEKLA